MIYTVTLNPTLDITYVVKDLQRDETNIASQVLKGPGGKGINVSRALHNLRVDSLALALIGGFTGTEVEFLLHKEGLLLWLVRIASETRTNVVIMNQKDGTQMSITAQGPRVKPVEHQTLVRILDEITQAPGHLVLSGSIPPAVHPDIYDHLIRSAKGKGLITVLDTSGEPLRAGIMAGPHLIKPNRHELENLVGRKLSEEKELLEAARSIVASGVQTVVVSLGEEGALMVDTERAWRGRGPVIRGKDTVGAGDSMVAGLLMGMLQAKPPDEIFRMGLACGTAAVMSPAQQLSKPGTFKRALPGIKVEEIKRKK